MCVLIAAKRKKFVKRPEIVEAMRTNASGFAMMAVRPDNSRDSIRTLSDKELLDFFDNKVKDDDAIAFHARIPSRGEKSLENVHGWMIEGVWTGHNMTISTLDEVMREDKWNGTDSEYFFRHIFGPLYKSLGDVAFKDGKFHPYLDRIIRCFLGSSNKFLFVLPDGTFVRYGHWVNEPDRKENGEIAFWASNTSYKVYERSWSPATGKTVPEPAPSGYGYGYGYGYHGRLGYADDDEEDYYKYWQDRAPLNSKAKPKGPIDFDGATLIEAAGVLPVMRTGIKLHVLANVAKYREAMIGDLPGEPVLGKTKTFATAYQMPVDFAVDDTSLPDAANPCAYLPKGETVGSVNHCLAWACGWAAALEEYLETTESKVKTRHFHMPKATLRANLNVMENRIDAALAALDCCVDLTRESPEEAFVAFAMTTSRKGRPTMVKAMLSDLITPDTGTDADALAAVTTVLEAIQAIEESGEDALLVLKGANAPETQEGALKE